MLTPGNLTRHTHRRGRFARVRCWTLKTARPRRQENPRPRGSRTWTPQRSAWSTTTLGATWRRPCPSTRGPGTNWRSMSQCSSTARSSVTLLHSRPVHHGTARQHRPFCGFNSASQTSEASLSSGKLCSTVTSSLSLGMTPSDSRDWEIFLVEGDHEVGDLVQAGW